MKKFDQQVERISSLRHEAVSEALVTELRKALGNRNNYMVSKAAAVVAHHRLQELIPQLRTAYDRFFVDAVRSDPQCWAKIALARAMAELDDYEEPDCFVRGIQHVQMEPVWGKHVDTAGPLRAQCCLALVNCRTVPSDEMLRILVTALADAEPGVRSESAHAMEELGRIEGALVLRLKALVGDEEPEVTGACLRAVLAIEAGTALSFVCKFLERDEDVATEAALALGLSRLPGVVAPVIVRYRRELDASRATVFLTALAVSQKEDAMEFLFTVVEREKPERAVAAIEALASVRAGDVAVRDKVSAAVSRNGDSRVAASFDKKFSF
ncbi:MAG: hypothetical protein H7039_18480 [Bryobacteraceae bacterium]|nr:hypothetical protein [Bryobacteraceae bacterium]